VQVLHHQHERLLLAQSRQHTEHQLEQLRRAPGSGGRAVVLRQLGQQSCQLPARRPEQPVEVVGRRRPDEGAQRLHQRDQWQTLPAELDAPTGQDADVGARPAGKGGLHQAALPDPRLAAHQQDDGATSGRAGHGGAQCGQLLVPSDEDGTDDVHGHGANAGTPGASEVPQNAGRPGRELGSVDGRRI
jgi:hypothetical protein